MRKSRARYDISVMAHLGYRHYPNRGSRPHCEMCGPFRGPFLRPCGSDDFGTLYRCHGCDNE